MNSKGFERGAVAGEPSWAPGDVLKNLGIVEFFFSNDYRVLALKTLFTSFVMLALAGLFALTFRLELTAPGIQFFGARPYMGLMTVHGMLMVFGFLIPMVVGLSYYMMPRVLRTERLLWAPLAQWSYWLLIVAAVLLVIGRPDFTWTVYAPMSLRVGGDLVWMGYLAVLLVALSEFLAGAVLLRNALAWAGSLRDYPLMGWGMLTEGIMLLFSTPALGAVGLFLLTDWLGTTALFDPAAGGSTTFFLWLFWFYGHPAVYLPLVPAIAIVYTLLPRFLGRPLWSKTSAVIAFMLLLVLSFGVFHHHFQPSVPVHGWVQRIFQILTLMIFVPSTLHVFNWLASLLEGPIPPEGRSAVPFKFLMGAIFFIIFGGVVGFLNAQIAIDSDFIHNTYWIPGHFHAMFLGFCAQVAVAGIYYLYPYFTGRMYNRRLAELHFWLWQVGIFGQVAFMYALGYAFFPRWVVDYLPLPAWSSLQLWLTVSVYLVGLGFLLFVWNFLRSYRRGEVVTADPWEIRAPATAVAGAAAVSGGD